jgi:site-specific recombinase XerD
MDTLSRYSVDLLGQGIFPTTILSRLAAVNRYFRWLHETQNVPKMAFHTPELPKQKRKVKDVLSPEMFEHYFRVASGLHEPMRTAALLLPCTGLRSNEMVSLPLLATRRSSFEHGGVVKDTQCLIITGKGGNERIVPILDEGVGFLLAYTRGWRRTRADETYMFPGKHLNEHLSTRALREAVQKIRGALRMKFTPHTMRRTYLTSLYRKGVEPVMLAKIAGHSNVQFLVDYYLALDEHDVVRAVHETGGRLSP